MIRAAAIALVAATAAGPALAQPGTPPVRPGKPANVGPAELEGIEIEEKLGARIPRDVELRDHTGAPVSIGSLLDGNRPVLLTFYYSNCPMLCSVQLGDLIDVLNKSPWVVGDKFRIVSISMDPRETHRQAFETREGYLDRYKAPEVSADRRFTIVEEAVGEGGAEIVARWSRSEHARPSEAAPVDDRTAIAEGWTFLVGDERSVRRIADAVGFTYNYVPAKKEYAHPTAIVVLSATGKVVSYLHGLSYEPADLTSRVVSAALDEPTSSTAQFLYSCFHFVEPSGFTAIALGAMRYGGLIFVALLLAGLGTLHLRRRRAMPSAPAPERIHEARAGGPL